MKNLTATLVVCLSTFVGVTYSAWQDLTCPPGYIPQNGSALCAGIAIDKYVWFLQNGLGLNDLFLCYDIAHNTWISSELIPFIPMGEGGAVAYVQMLTISPPNGWVFAFRGNNTQEFWVYGPGSNTWQRGPDVPEPVIDGGCLCYGGLQFIDGVDQHVLYAFTGQHDDNAGYWQGHFFRYTFPDPGVLKGPNPALLGEWRQLAKILGKVSTRHPALTWVPMDDPSGLYPMGVVVAMKNDLDHPPHGVIYHYYPDQDTWREIRYIPDPTNPQEYARLDDGACMTSHFRDRTMFLFGESYPRHYAFYDVATHSITILASTPHEVTKGAAITALHWEGEAYVEFGGGGLPYFSRWVPPPEEGEQGTITNPSSQLKVAVYPSQVSHIFSVRCEAGPVRLSVMDVTGRRVCSSAKECRGEMVDITWIHPTIANGVYFWSISTKSGGTNGKLVITK
jgi:hypothetical protein